MDPSSDRVPNQMEKKEVGKSKMGGGNSGLHYSRRCKSKSITNMESLPDDLMFNILGLVPAQDIYDNVRFVCRKWYRIIRTRNFIYAHFQQHTTTGILVRDTDDRHCPVFVAMRRGRIEVSKLNYNSISLVWASCDGLTLEHEWENEDAHFFYIANPVTKQRLALPQFLPVRPGSYGIAYAAASMVYKVVVTYATHYGWNSKKGCAILTVGVDNSWRHVDIQHLSDTARERLRNRSPLLITDGFMHWSFFLTLNVETEIISENFTPQVFRETIRELCFSTGRYLSLLIPRSKLSWEVWEIKPETGDWTRLPNIDLEDQKCKLEQFDYKRKSQRHRKFEPVGWLKYKEVLVLGSFDAFRTFIAYNIRTQEIDSFELISGRRLCFFNNLHRNSLVWLDG